MEFEQELVITLLFVALVAIIFVHWFLTRDLADHDWDYYEDDRRLCLTCGQREELDHGSGFCGSAWMVEVKGDHTKHERNDYE